VAYIYPKPQQKNPGKQIWMVRVKIADSLETFSLRLAAPENKRIAEERANDFEYEIRAGALSEKTREWLGSSATRADVLLGQATIKAVVEPGNPQCWEAAVTGFLKACEPKDTRGEVRGKINPIDRTKVQRRHVLRRFQRWTEANRLPFMKQSFTATAREYLEYEVSRGQKSTTINGGAYPFLMLLGDWMADRGLCERPNRKRIHEVVPDMIPPAPNLPDWQADRDTIRFFYDRRFTEEHNWKRNRRYWAAWCLIVVVRGLGCRPTEALSLSWDTVNLEPGYEKVRFVDTKDGRKTGRPHRTAPILFEWVREAFIEMRERSHKPGGAVCLNAIGRFWKDDSSGNQMIREILQQNEMDSYTLKKSQKLYITQLIQAGFPPHVVAFWTGHTLTIQERHYIEETAYLPHAVQDYEGFGKLSTHGEAALRKFARFSGEMGQGVTTGGNNYPVT
jgi:integrase